MVICSKIGIVILIFIQGIEIYVVRWWIDGGVFTAWEASMNHANCGFAILKEWMCKGCLKGVLTGGLQWDQH